MPFQIKQEKDKFIVYNLDTMKKQGSYETRALAMKRMKALYADEKSNEGKPKKASEAEEDIEEESAEEEDE